MKRRHLIYYLRVFDSKNDSLVGHVIDITTEGIKLFNEKPIEPGKEFKFRMALPEFIKENVEIEFDKIRKQFNANLKNKEFEYDKTKDINAQNPPTWLMVK